MKIVLILCLPVTGAPGSLYAQQYKVATEQSGSFSVGLVQLLNCAIE
ncbi:MAG: hypothetical protein H7Y01_09880 [Ferruginibacter sp.]|nr:hypothetical protein [Chitinophagaceae bacterium]